MKNTKKLLALLLAVVMVFAVGAMTVFAEEEPATTKLTINDADEAATYAGYQLMSSTDDGNGKFAYTVNSKYSALMQELLGKTTDSAVIDAIAAMDEDAIRDFADELYAKIKTAGLAADETLQSKTAKEVAQGYWMIAETTDTADKAKATSQVILDTKGTAELTVTPKKDLPDVKKEADKTTADVGQEVTFTLTGTTKNFSDSYTKYEYIFEDTMTNLAFVEDSVAVTIDGAAVSLTDANTKDDYTASCVGNKLTVTFADLKDVVTKDSKIVVTYKATVTEDAIESGESENEVIVKYSNNPYDASKTGTTPPSDVKVYVINLIIDKYDGSDNTKKLENAVFTLKNSDNKFYSWDDTNKKVVWTNEQVTFKTDADGAIKFEGLAIGTYTLTEITAPDGYNKLAAPITVAVTASDNADGGKTYSAATATFEAHNGTVSVENNSGTELPSTGGMGTVLFITVGAILFVAAGIVLTAKKRLYNEG